MMKNRMICVLLALVLMLSLLAGCGAKQEAPASEEPAPAQEAPAQEAPAQEAPAEPAEPEPVESEPEVSAAEAPAEPESEEGEDYAIPTADLAMEYIDCPVEELIAALGEPDSSSYASSCAGPGEDGELYYKGFTAYTYREGDTETVVDVFEE